MRKSTAKLVAGDEKFEAKVDEGRIDSEELKSNRRWCQKGTKPRCFRGLEKGNRKDVLREENGGRVT